MLVFIKLNALFNQKYIFYYTCLLFVTNRQWDDQQKANMIFLLVNLCIYSVIVVIVFLAVFSISRFYSCLCCCCFLLHCFSSSNSRRNENNRKNLTECIKFTFLVLFVEILKVDKTGRDDNIAVCVSIHFSMTQKYTFLTMMMNLIMNARK